MKYNYIETKVLPNRPDAMLEIFKDEEQYFWELLNPNRYRRAYIKIGIDGTNESFYIDTQQIIAIDGAIDEKLKTIFTDTYSDNYFSPAESEQVNDYVYTSFHDVEQLHHQVRLGCNGLFYSSEPDTAPTLNIPLDTPLTELPDILLFSNRYPTNLARIHTTTIAFVNGLAHQTTVKENLVNGIYIKDGGKTSNITGYHYVNLLSFEKVGLIQIFPLSDLTLTPENEWFSVIQASDVPIDITNSQIILSIAGYLIFPQASILDKTGSHSFSFDLRSINLESKIVEASKYINLSTLGLDLSVNDDDPESSQLTNDVAIQALLALSQSFLIVVPKKNVVIYGTRVVIDNNTRVFHTYYDPKQLLKTNTDRLVSYWPSQAKSGYNVNIRDHQLGRDIRASALFTKLSEAFPDYASHHQYIKNAMISVGYYNGPVIT